MAQKSRTRGPLCQSIRNLARMSTPQPLLEYYRNKRNARRQEESRLQEMVGPPGLFKESRDFQLQFLKARGMRPGHQILDIGCGPLRGGLPLIRFLDAQCYTGVDVRSEVVEEALTQIRKHSLTNKHPTVICSAKFGQKELGRAKFDYIWCFQLFYHLDDDLVADCLKAVASRLKADGVCFATVNTHAREGSWKEFPYTRRPTDFYAALAERCQLEMKDLGPLQDHGFTSRAKVGKLNPMLEFRLRHRATV